MSLNITPLTEKQSTVLNGVQVSISSADLVSSFPILGLDGSTAAPTYSFASATDSGMFRRNSPFGVSVSVEGVLSLGVLNSSVITRAGDDRSGEGVVGIASVVTAPSGGVVGGGGFLYWSGSAINFQDSSGTVTDLTTTVAGDVVGPSSATDNELVRWGDTSGRVVTTSGVTFASSQLQPAAGSPTTPTYSFTTDPTSGVYGAAVGTVGLAAGGTAVATVNASAVTTAVPLQVPPGAAATPGATFTSDTTSGVFHGSSHTQLVTATNPAVAVTGRNVAVAGGPAAGYGTGADGVLFVPTATTVPSGVPNGGSGGVLYVTAGGTELRWLNASGADVLLGGDLPGVGSTTDGALAVWTDATGSSVAARTVITNAGVVAAVQSATLTNPAYSFTGDTTTGVGRAAAETVRVVAAGTAVWDVASSTGTATVPWEGPAGTAGAPQWTFTADTTAGVFNRVNNTVSVTAGGTTALEAIATRTASLGGGAGDGAGGNRVVAVVDAVTNPTTAPVGGGLVYVDGNSLLFRDSSNTAYVLTDMVDDLGGASVDNAVVLYNGTSGQVVDDGTVPITISDAGVIAVAATPGYSFSSAGTFGLSSGGADTVRLTTSTGNVVEVSTTTTTFAVEPLHSVDGTVAAPALGVGGATTGMYLSGVNTLGWAAGGVQAWVVDGSANVGLGRATPDFGGGAGVVWLGDVATPPVGTLTSGGLLYVDGVTLTYHTAAGTTVTLSGVDSAAGATTDNTLAYFTDTTGTTITDASIEVTDAGIMVAPVGAVGAPSLTVSSGGDAGLWSSGAGVLDVASGGSTRVQVSTAAVNSIEPVQADTTLRWGGATGVTESVSSGVLTSTLADASGTFVWQQNGTTIFQTTTDEDVDVLSNLVRLTGGTGDATIGFDGTYYAINLTNAADTLTFTVNSTNILTATSSALTVTGDLSIDSPRGNSLATGSDGYFFTNATTTGLAEGLSPTFRTNNEDCIAVSSGSVVFGRSSTVPPSRTASLTNAATVPSTFPASGMIWYAVNGDLMHARNTEVDVIMNPGSVRARYTHTQSGVISATPTVVNGSTTVFSQIATVVTGTITGTANTAGWWEITAQASWAAAVGATGYRQVEILVGGSPVAEATANAVTTASIVTAQQVEVRTALAASAAITVRLTHTQGSNLDCDVVVTAVMLG